MSSESPATDRVDRRQVVVVGGGAIGLSAGYHLASAGVDVAVVDRGELGAGASWGNAGWIVPSLVHPFNAPGAAPQAFRAMLDPNSPIAMRQIPTPGLATWGWRFIRASTPARSEASLRELSRLVATAAADMQDLAETLGFECRQDGLLVPFRTTQELDEYRDSHSRIEELGYAGRVERLDATQAHEREPALGSEVVGALHFLDEMSVRPASFTAALAAGTRSAGGETSPGEEVLEIVSVERSRWRVTTARRTIITDAVVVAAGEHTARLVRPLGVRLPLRSGRGCSVTLGSDQLTLRQPIKIAEHRVACTPFANGDVRVSGTFDLTGLDAGTAVGRMRSVLRAGATHLPALADVQIDPSMVWSGARPCVPDSVPVVGRADRSPGLFVATGHGTLGITLAPETGRRIADLVSKSLHTIASQGDVY